MSVTVSATGTELLTTASGATSVNYTGLTIPGALSNSALVVLISGSPIGGGAGPTAFVVTWSGTTVPLVTGASLLNQATNKGSVQINALVAPASGNLTLAISWTGTAQLSVIALALSGVNQTGGATSFANGAASFSTGAAVTLSKTVTSATGDMVFGTWEQTGSASFTSLNDTQLYVDNGGQNMDSGANSAAGAATVTLTATLSSSSYDMCFAGCDVVAAAGGSTCQSGGLAMSGVGCSIGWRAALLGGGAWRIAQEIESKRIIARRRLILPCHKINL